MNHPTQPDGGILLSGATQPRDGSAPSMMALELGPLWRAFWRHDGFRWLSVWRRPVVAGAHIDITEEGVMGGAGHVVRVVPGPRPGQATWTIETGPAWRRGVSRAGIRGAWCDAIVRLERDNER